jgi:Protein of unknown function (DUF2971)
VFFKRDAVTANAEKTRNRLREGVQSIYDGVSMKCFSEEFASVLQWSYYADGHKGYCIGFSLPTHWNFINDDGALGRIGVLPARYGPHYPVLNLDNEYDSEDEKEELLHALLAKAREWVHEKEWRALRIECKPGIQVLPKGTIQSVYFGAEMPTLVKHDLKKIVSDADSTIEIFEMKISSDR